jgi:hypothetical protein
MSFLRTLSSLMRTREGLPGRSPIAPSQARLTLELFCDGLLEKKLQLVDTSILINPIKPWDGVSHKCTPTFPVRPQSGASSHAGPSHCLPSKLPSAAVEAPLPHHICLSSSISSALVPKRREEAPDRSKSTAVGPSPARSAARRPHVSPRAAMGEPSRN